MKRKVLKIGEVVVVKGLGYRLIKSHGNLWFKRSYIRIK